MSLWKFGDFEREIDFTDAAFMDRVESAADQLNKEVENLPKDGKESVSIRAQNRVYDNYFNRVFGKGTSNLMFGGSESLAKRIEAASSINEFRLKQADEFSRSMDPYQVRKPVNRAQRRDHQKKRDRR